MNKYIILFFFFFKLALLSAQVTVTTYNEKFSMPQGISEDQYLQKTIIFKIKPDYRNKCSDNEIAISELKDFFQSVKLVNLTRKFQHSSTPQVKSVNISHDFVDITLIYELKYESDIPLEKAINALYATGVIMYAVPHYIPRLLYVPNDSRIASQYGLKNVMAFAGWDICKGDTNTVIGISDTGTDLTHPDLKDNIKYNYNDPIDGIDNDNDGYIDNFYGWNFGGNNNNTQAVVCYKNGVQNGGLHGIHVSGIAAASTDNNLGIAGAGFKCKILPVKIADSTGDLVYAFESIVYAADHGCSIINCSWGDTISSGAYGQDIINYATFNRNVLVVAAAGNVKNNSSAPWYPASYNYVLSVAGTDSNDVKWNESSYGKYVDVCAPSVYIFSTWQNGTYIYSAGTSMAAPLVSGLAAIVKSYFPQLSALQIGEQLKVTADNIDTIKKNVFYAQQMGAGRVNLYRALTITNIPSVNFLTDKLNLQSFINLSKNDTIKIAGDFINYLAPTTDLKVTLTTSSSNVKILNPEIDFGILQTLEKKNDLNNPFKVLILPTVKENEQIDFKFEFTDKNYSAYQNFSILINANYITIDTNLVAATFSGTGNIGYNDAYATQGIGFTYKHGRSLMSCGGLIFGNSSVNISDNIYDSQHNLDRDFYSLSPISKVIPPITSDIDAHAVFNDSLAGTNKLNVTVNQNVYAWNKQADAKYIICEYVFKNKSNSDISNFHAGLFMDWDIGSNRNNIASFDENNKLGYVYPLNSNPFTGIKLLTTSAFNYYAIDNDGTNGSINIYDGLSDFEKFIALTSDRYNAGGTTGNDVSHILSAGPFLLKYQDSLTVAFALLAGDNLPELVASGQSAFKRYTHDTAGSVAEMNRNQISMSQNYPNPFSDKTYIDINLPVATAFDLSIYTISGEKIYSQSYSAYPAGSYTLKIQKNNLGKGCYFYRLKTSEGSVTKKLMVD